VLADPNVAYLLMTIGTIGLIAELYNPGMLFPGITGAIALILAFIAFGTLPVNWGGVVLVVLGVGLLVFDLYTEGVGVPAVGGLVAFIIGSLFLFTPLTPTSPAAPDVRVNPWLIGGVTAAVVGFAVFVLGAVLTAR